MVVIDGVAVQFNGVTVRRVPVRVDPSFLACVQGCSIGQTLFQHQALESRQPMMVVARPIVGLTSIGRCLEFISKGGGPFIPGEVPKLGQFDGERK